MKKSIVALAIGLLFVGANVFAAGDLVVNGKLGVGQAAPAAKLHVESANELGLRTLISKSSGDNLLTAVDIDVVDTVAAGTKGVVSMDFKTSHQASGGYYTQNFISSQYWLDMLGGSTGGSTARVQGNNLTFGGSGTYTLSSAEGILNSMLFKGSTTVNLTDLAFFKAAGNLALGTGSLNVTSMTGVYITDFAANGAPGGTQTNVSGIQIDKQSMGVNKMGIWLNGDGAGADIVLGPNKEARIYSSGGEIFVKDGLSNVTQISPHDPKTGEWIYYSTNTKTGVVKRVNMEKLIKAVEKLTGESFMIETLVNEN